MNQHQGKAANFSHPMLWVAGIAITLFCAAGIAALMGWIPTSMGQSEDKAALTRSDKAGIAQPPAAQRQRSTPAQVASIAKTVRCADCGVIESTRQITTKGSASGIGVVGGAVVGGLLGSQIGGGRGKDVATVAGAVGGGFAGNEVEKRMNSTASSEITVRMEDGSSRVINEAGATSWNRGDRVRIADGALRAN